MKTSPFFNKTRSAALTLCLLALALSLPASAMSSRSALIGLEAAKTAALADADRSASEVTFVKAELDRENGIQVYDIEFRTQDGQEFDYKINAETGAVISSGNESPDCPQPSGPSSYIGEEKARGIALAKVPGAGSGDIKKLKLDCENNRWVYEVEIIYNGTEYEGEIDASSGEIVEWKSEQA